MTNEPYLATTDEDKDIVTAMHRLCFAETEMPGLQVALDDKRYFIILVGDDEDGWPTGYVVCRIIDGESTLLWIGVRSEHRGEGWGRILTSAALDESRIRGAETIDLYVAEDNTPAIHLYKSLGFVNVDTHVGFYAHIQGGADDAYVMRASLIKKETESDKDEPYLVKTDQDRDAVAALHSLCFHPEEMSKLEVALDDKDCFAFLVGEDVDGQPTGYGVVRVQEKSSIGLWYGVRADRLHLKRNRSRTKGLGRALMVAGINEARARGAEYMDGYVSGDNRACAITLRMHKEMGYVLVDSLPAHYIVDGKGIECTNYHLRRSLMI